MGKDVIISLCGLFNKEVLNHAIEFAEAESIRTLGADERLAIVNMTTELGALSVLFPVIEMLLACYRERVKFHGPGYPRISELRIKDIEFYPIIASLNMTNALTLNLSTLSSSI